MLIPTSDVSILNEVLSITAQELRRHGIRVRAGSVLLNEVLSITAQEFAL